MCVWPYVADDYHTRPGVAHITLDAEIGGEEIGGHRRYANCLSKAARNLA